MINQTTTFCSGATQRVAPDILLAKLEGLGPISV
jgi:hypothetical protein